MSKGLQTHHRSLPEALLQKRAMASEDMLNFGLGHPERMSVGLGTLAALWHPCWQPIQPERRFLKKKTIFGFFESSQLLN